jgi:lipid-binding SYLF domain-containing protein
VIKNAKGLAIFTTMRTGLWFSGAGGSGILVARLPDGSWSPPSGLLLHTAGLGFLVGVDIYDCVMVINTQKALDAFKSMRFTLGGEVSAVAGPVGIGGVLETELHKRQAPVFTYLKSRGFYAGVQIDGTVLIERGDENEKFYGQRLKVEEILGGKVRHPPYEIRMLMQTIKAAQGDNVDEAELPTGPSPSDFDMNDNTVFGVPDKEDPDPYGVLALEKEGLEIREAGTKSAAPRESFIFNPSPSSPVFKAFNRNSLDGRSLNPSQRNSWRMSSISTATQTMDMGTQTDLDQDTPATSLYSAASSGLEKVNEHRNETSDNTSIAKDLTKEPAEELSKPEEIDTSSAERRKDSFHLNHFREQLDGESDDEESEEPAVVVHAIQHVTPPTFMSKARVVNVQKQPPPALPPRNPVRDRKAPLIITGDMKSAENTHDKSTSPISSGLQSSAGATKVPEVERMLSDESFSSVELNEEKNEMRNAHDEHEHEHEHENKAPSDPNAAVTTSPSLPEPERIMPGQF